MRYKKIIILIIIICLISFALSVILTAPDYIGLCDSKNTSCIHRYIDSFDNIAQPLGIFSVAIFIISLILLFAREEIFRTWSKFSIVYIPISLILIGLARSSAPNIISFDKESLTFFLATIFLIASLVIIIFKSIKLRGK